MCDSQNLQEQVVSPERVGELQSCDGDEEFGKNTSNATKPDNSLMMAVIIMLGTRQLPRLVALNS